MADTEQPQVAQGNGKARTKPISRRKFLKGLGLTGAAVVATGAGRAPKRKPSVKKGVHYGMAVDLHKCFGCHACSVSCKAWNEVPLGVWRSWVNTAESGTYPKVQRGFLPVLCNHCSNPPCVPVCPVNATYKRAEDGVVVVDEDKCIGAGNCVAACPYEMRYLHPLTAKAQKCDFCIERVKQGLVPACVNTCNASARIFGDLNDPDSDISRVLRENPHQALRTDFGTKPNVFYIGPNQKNYKPKQPIEASAQSAEISKVTA